MKLLRRWWEFRSHCNVCLMVHTESKLHSFSTGEERNTWSRCARGRGRFSLFCSGIVWLLLQPNSKSSVSGQRPFQSLQFKGSFYSQHQSHNHIRSQQPCCSSPATSSCFQVLPTMFQVLSLNTSQSSSSTLGLFTDFTGIATIPSVALQIKRLRRALPVLASQKPVLHP